jgi:hypothetical protein
MANFIYNSARQLFSQGSIDWTGTSVRNPDWVPSTLYTVGQKVQAIGNVYVCIQNGTSSGNANLWTEMRTASLASTRDPSIVDNDVRWKYMHCSFEKYSIQAALVNMNNTGAATTMQIYSPAATVANGTNDNIPFAHGVPGATPTPITGTRNMNSEFGFSSATDTGTSLIRNANVPIVATLTGRTFVPATQACTAANITFPAVPDVGSWGTNIEGMVIYLKNESPGATTTGDDWPVLLYIDTLSGSTPMFIDPNGGDIVVQWNASGIFRL